MHAHPSLLRTPGHTPGGRPLTRLQRRRGGRPLTSLQRRGRGRVCRRCRVCRARPWTWTPVPGPTPETGRGPRLGGVSRGGGALGSGELRSAAGEGDLGHGDPLLGLEHGARLGVADLLVTRDGAYRASPPPVEAISTIGAGDAFNAGFLYAMGKGKSLPTALRWAVACGTASVTVPGVRAASRAQVARLVAQIAAETVR